MSFDNLFSKKGTKWQEFYLLKLTQYKFFTKGDGEDNPSTPRDAIYYF